MCESPASLFFLAFGTASVALWSTCGVRLIDTPRNLNTLPTLSPVPVKHLMHSKGLLLPSHQSTYVQIAVAAHFSFVPACPTCKEAEEGPRVPYLC